MRRNPIYVFKDQTTLGITDIPLESMIQIIDSDGVGTPLFIQLTDKTGLSASSTIADFLAISSAYVNLDKDTLSELEKVGDGWRLLGKNPAMYSTPGTNAVDLSTSEVAGNYGARGVASFAVGTGTKAQNPNSVAMGTYNVGANSDTLLEIGDGTYTNPKNVIEIFKNGTILAPDATTAEIDNAGSRALTTVEYVQNRVALEFPSKTTDDLAEGTNLYYTAPRDTANFNTNIALQNIDVLADVDTTSTVPTTGQVLKWDGGKWIPGNDNDSVTSVNAQAGNVILTTDDIAEGSNLYYTSGRFDAAFGAKTTDALPEGVTNEYYNLSKGQTAFDSKITSTLLSTLNDVSPLALNAPLNRVLMSNGASWEPGIVDVGVTSVNGDVDVVTLALSDINEVEVAGATTGQVLSYDGLTTNWVPLSIDKTYVDALGVNATTVNGLTVETAVPTPAVFTDTLYDATVIQAEVDNNTNAIGDATTGNAALDAKITVNTNAIGDATTGNAALDAKITVNTNAIITKEADLLVPTTDGDVLSSTTAGTRSWITPVTYAPITATTGGVLTDADAVKFDGIAAGATADADVTATTGGVLTDADAVKFDGIEALAAVNFVGTAVADSSGTDAAANATTINALLTSLRTAGIIA